MINVHEDIGQTYQIMARYIEILKNNSEADYSSYFAYI
jgi:hypothetical protein